MNKEKLFEEVFRKAKIEPPEQLIEALMNTSFNDEYMSREEAIKAAKNIGPKLYEQTYGKNSRLYFHASNKPHDPIRETIQPNSTRESLCFFANNPEAALAVANARHNWSYDFCFLHVCKIKSPVDLFNPQSISDNKRVSFTQNEMSMIQNICNWLKQEWNFDAPERWWRIYENGSIPSAVKKAGFYGIALNFWDMKHSTPEKDKTEGIALFNGNQMKVCGIKVVGLKDEIKNYNEYLKGLKNKDELEKEYKNLI